MRLRLAQALALTALLALVVGGTSASAASEGTSVIAKASALSKRQITKLVKKEAKKAAKRNPGPAGPPGPQGPPGPAGGVSGTASADAIIFRAPFGGSVAPAYSRNGITILMNCNVNGTMVIRTQTDNAAVANFGLNGNGNLFGGFVGDFDAGPNNEQPVQPVGTAAIGTLIYTPNGGNPVTINYNVQFSTAQENCILTGTALYS